MSLLRVGILGPARVAAYAMIAPARAHRRVEVTAIAGRDVARADAYAKHHEIGRVHADAVALIADPAIDLVYVATPPTAHAALAIAALDAGKAVLIEKPLAMNAAEARAIDAAAASAGRPAIEAFHYRHHRRFARVLELSARLGRLSTLEARFLATIAQTPEEFRWRGGDGGGALMDLGCYCLHWMRTVAGQEPQVVEAWQDKRGEVDAETKATLAFPNGAVGRLHASMIGPGREASLRIEGARGWIQVTNPLAPQLGHALAWAIDGEAGVETVDGPSTFDAQLDAVVRHLLDGDAFPLPPGDAHANMAAIDAIRAAAA
jgi:predicted dehydrogenase